jgi:hypothetical protein
LAANVKKVGASNPEGWGTNKLFGLGNLVVIDLSVEYLKFNSQITGGPAADLQSFRS